MRGTDGLDFAGSVTRPAGIDEVGRGPLAGPVVAAAVVLGERISEGVADSKALSAKRRGIVAGRIRHDCLTWSLGRAEPAEIDALNIRASTFLAMERALGGLTLTPDYVWVDGRECPRLPCAGEPIVGGDSRVAAIGAASILAKEARDAEMIRAADRYTGYGFERHKGYPTPEHLAALDRLGPCQLHRRSFAPVRQRLASA